MAIAKLNKNIKNEGEAGYEKSPVNKQLLQDMCNKTDEIINDYLAENGGIALKNDDKANILEKSRTINGIQYKTLLSIGSSSGYVAANFQLQDNTGKVAGRLNIALDGKLYNGVSSKQLVESNVVAGDLTYDTAYFEAVDYAKYAKFDKIVEIIFRAKIKQAIPSNHNIITLPANSVLPLEIDIRVGGRYDRSTSDFAYVATEGNTIKYGCDSSKIGSYTHICVTYISS